MDIIASDGSLKEIVFCWPDLSTISKLYRPINNVSTDRQFYKIGNNIKLKIWKNIYNIFLMYRNSNLF